MLTITPISFSGIRNLPKSSFNNATLPKLGQDSFSKRNNVSFRGNGAEFANWMRENEFCLHDIQRMICDENLIGAGNYSTVFSIPECDEYVLKVSNYDVDSIKTADLSQARLKINDEELGINIGQKVAAIEIPTIFPMPMEIQVLKKQAGESVGVQPPETIKENEKSYEDYSRKEKYERTIHKLAQLPVESYEQLLSDFVEADRLGYVFDYLNSNNLLVDEENKKINLIDMEKYGLAGNLSGLLYSLTNAQYYRTYCDKYYMPVSEAQREQATNDTIEIIKKFTLAMKKQGLKFDRNKVTYEANTYLFGGYPCWLAFGAMNEYQVWDRLSQMGLVK